MMTLEQFKQQIEQANELSLIDDLCWKWLRQAASSNGRDGEIALALMETLTKYLLP